MSGITADEVLELRKKYKRAKTSYRAGKMPAMPVEAPPAPAKPARKPRAARARTEKELANDARLRALTARAKEIRAADPSMKWTLAVKSAAQEMKK